MARRTCSEPGCDRPLTDELHMACPDQLLPLAGMAADLDAQAIVRTVWPHLIEASLAGLEPFTLEPLDAA